MAMNVTAQGYDLHVVVLIVETVIFLVMVNNKLSDCTLFIIHVLIYFI